MVTEKEVAARIKELRLILGGTQEAFADRCELSHQSYRQYEGGRNYPSFSAMYRFCLVGADLNYMAMGTGKVIRPVASPYDAQMIDQNQLSKILREVERTLKHLGLPRSEAAIAELAATLYNYAITLEEEKN